MVVDALLDDRPETPPHHVHVRIINAVAEHTTVVDGELRGWVEVTGDTDVLLGISTVSAEDAVANLRAAGDFTAMREQAEDRWVAELDVLQVEGATDDQLVSLYSGLYRAFLYPTRAGRPLWTGHRATVPRTATSCPSRSGTSPDPRSSTGRSPRRTGSGTPTAPRGRCSRSSPRTRRPTSPRASSDTSPTAAGPRAGVPPAPRTS